jgi:hypothetical protein
MESHQELLRVADHLYSHPSDKYIQHFIEVPEGVAKLGLVFNYHNEFSETNLNKEVMYISLQDPNGFRGHRMNPSGRGDVTLELWLSADESSEGAIPGPIPAGRWLAQIDIRVLRGETDYQLVVYCEMGASAQGAASASYPADYVTKPEAGWYKGELHAHSTESDGKVPVAQVIEAAHTYGLDYFSLTDHNTSSQWHKLAKLVNPELALIRSLEITSRYGHANLHGLTDWVNVYIDQPGWSANQAADETHRQGGLVCINHAFSGDLSWQDFSLDWGRVDLEEIYHNLEGCNNSYQLSLWDQHLNAGYRIVGVGGIDSHNPTEGLHELGQVVTWIYADELSEKGIVQGLKRGQVYVSRGPELRFQARTASGAAAAMWESLPAGEPVTLQVDFKWDKPLNLFILKNGMIIEVVSTPGAIDGWQTFVFTDEKTQPHSYYRVELHDAGVHMPYKGIQWRDYATMRVLSNPIWVGRDLPK